MNLLKSKFFLFGFFLIAIISLYFVFFKTSEGGKKTKSGKVEIKDFEQKVTIAGIIVPFRKTIVTAPYNGYVKKLFVKLGQKVQVNDPLVSVVQSLQSTDNPFPLRSPYSGSVVQIEKNEGEFVKEGDPKEFIMRIDDLSKHFVIANAPEIDRVKLKIGYETVVRASAIVNKKYKGIIREMSLAAKEKDQWARNPIVEFSIRIELLDADEDVKPGMSVLVDVITFKKPSVAMVRHEFVRKKNDKNFVFLENGEKREVQLGQQNEEGFEVLSGISEGTLLKQIDFSEIKNFD